MCSQFNMAGEYVGIGAKQKQPPSLDLVHLWQTCHYFRNDITPN